MQINDEFILFKFVSEIFDFKSFLKIRNFKRGVHRVTGKKTPEIFNGFGCVHLTDSALFRQQLGPMKSLLKNQSAI